jgi:cysteine synthase B
MPVGKPVFYFLLAAFVLETMLKTQTNIRPIRKTLSHGLLAAVGKTPLVPLQRIGASLPADVQLFAKAEWFNPGGSVKDRPAANIVRQAIAAGNLGGGKTLLDSTSGNMGISYATLCASLGIPVTLAIPASASVERLKILRALGAELHLSDALEGTDGALRLAQEILKQDPDRFFFADQYNNPANWQAHYQSTGPEIGEQTGGEVTHFVAGLGTTGTLMGVGRYLQEKNPEIKLIAVQPDSSFHGLEGLKHMPSSIHPGIYDTSLADEILEIPTEEAHEMTKRIARQEGLFVGVSSGAAAVAALRVAASLRVGRVVTMFPDSGYKYLSQNFWGFAP